MKSCKEKILARKRRHLRIKKKIFGSPLHRIGVFRSLKHIYAFMIEPYTNRTLFTVSSLNKEIREKSNGLKKTEIARLVGKLFAEKAKEHGIEKVVFDRSGYKYHGRVKELAEGAREGGLKF